MVKRLSSVLLAAAVLFLMVGCSVNQINEVQQPNTAAPNETIDVYIFDVYHIFSQTPVLGDVTVRDSLLISAALPNGWSVDTVNYYIDTSIFKLIGQVMINDSTLDPNFDIDKFLDSIRADIDIAAPTTQFDSLLGVDYPITNRAYNSFLGLNPINLPAGTVTDTTLEDTTGLSGQDSVYDKMVGCLIWMAVTVGSDTGNYSLGYFVGFQPHALGGTQLSTENAFSDDHLITITATGLADLAARNLNLTNGFRVSPNPITFDAPMSYFVPFSLQADHGTISLFDAHGTCRASSPVAVKDGWNQLNLRQLAKNEKLNGGMYIMRLKAGNREITRHIIIAR